MLQIRSCFQGFPQNTAPQPRCPNGCKFYSLLATWINSRPMNSHFIILFSAFPSLCMSSVFRSIPCFGVLKDAHCQDKRFFIFLVLIAAFSHDFQCVKQRFRCLFVVQTSLGLWALFSKLDFACSRIRGTSQSLTKTHWTVHPRLA